MKISTTLLKAPHVGVRELKAQLSRFLKNNKATIITDRGKPKNVIVAYDDLLELVDVVDELSDKMTMKLVKEGRKAIGEGAEGIPVSQLFSKLRED